MSTPEREGNVIDFQAALARRYNSCTDDEQTSDYIESISGVLNYLGEGFIFFAKKNGLVLAYNPGFPESFPGSARFPILLDEIPAESTET